MSPSVTENLIEICDRPVAGHVLARAGTHLLDWVGCAAVGATSGPGKALAAYAEDRSAGPCTAVGAGSREAAMAAFVNGGYGNIFELDDVHRTSIMHSGDVVIPAALAAAQRQNVTGRALLRAIVLGYEAAIRISSAASTSGYAPWYNSGVCGTFGAAIAAGHVIGLESARLADALGQAGMLSAGLWQCRLEPTYSKQLISARAAEAGVVAADLAGIGFPGPKAILEGELGFFAGFYPNARPDDVLDEPRADWKIGETSFKPWPACRHAHPLIEAGLKVHERANTRSIVAVRVETYRAAIDFCDNAQPETEHEGRFSLQHCFAAAALRGRVGFDEFSPAALSDQAITELRNKISISENTDRSRAFPTQYGAGLSVVFSDDTSMNIPVDHAKGDPENPVSDGELAEKFNRSASAAGVDDGTTARLAGTIERLMDQSDLAEFTAALETFSSGIEGPLP